MLCVILCTGSEAVLESAEDHKVPHQSGTEQDERDTIFEPSKIPAIVRSVLKKRDKVGDAHHVNAAFESRGIMHE